MDVRPVTLTGKAVRLEPLTLEHLEPLAEFALDPELWRLGVSRMETRDDLRRYIETALAEQARGVSLPFATMSLETGRPVGSTRFGNIDPANLRVEIGWTWIGRPWQRTAVNTDAKFLMLSHAFETWGCRRVEFKTSLLNLRSRAAILRLGAVEEGVLRSHMINPDGSRRDSVYFSILDTEWPAVKARFENR
jgi:RimJ/RimL family protein N-acetyltransferase